MGTIITDEYLKLNAGLHAATNDYGARSGRHVLRVMRLLARVRGRTVLDYGCGKGKLVEELRARNVPCQGFDPALPDLWPGPPMPADVVVCTDVLEHVEPDCIDAVLEDLRRCAKRGMLLNVALRPDKTKVLPDGSNPHRIVEPLEWWRDQFDKAWPGMMVVVDQHEPEHHFLARVINKS
jgi:ubiquinone/menaquinone biosynthesis C-methylase UbiE